MNTLRVFAVVLFCLGVFELAMVAKSLSSRRKATMLLQAADAFKLGLTSKAQAQASFSHIGLKSIDEACSSSAGSCEGISIEIFNTPEFLHSTFGRIVSYTAAQMSLVRPASLIGNFYFVSDRLESISVTLSTARANVGVALNAKDYDEDEGEIVRHNYHTGSDILERNVGPSRQREVSLKSAEVLNLKCLDLMVGCSSNRDLWLHMPGTSTKDTATFTKE